MQYRISSILICKVKTSGDYAVPLCNEYATKLHTKKNL